MQYKKFINILKKHKYGLMVMPVLVMIITFYIVRKLPDVYTSHSRLSAGLTAGSQSMQLAQQLLNGVDNNAESKVNQTFSNVTQTMQLKIVIDQVSYLLILHDLTSNDPYRQPSKLLKSLNEEAKQHAIAVYTQLYNERKPLYLMDKDQDGLNKVLVSMKYDYESLKDKIRINRVENSDFIDVTYDSDNPLLSAFVVNTLCKEFINYYASINQQNRLQTVDFLYEMMMKRKDSLDAKIEGLKNYKIENKILNTTDEAKNLYAQISDFEIRLKLAEREVEANQGAINSIDAKFNPQEKQYMEGRQALINQEIVNDQIALNTINDKYIRSGFDENIRKQVDSLKDVLAQRINQSTDKYIVNPLVSKEALIAQKLKLEMDLSLAKNGMRSYQRSIDGLNERLSALAPSEAVIQSYESDIAILTKEYLELLARFNQSNMQLSTTTPVKQIEMAVPGSKMPSKKIIMVALSGVVSCLVYLLILFVIFYLDDSVNDADDLLDKTDIRVLGALPVIKSSLLDIQKSWNLLPVNPSNNKITKLIGKHTDLQNLFGKPTTNTMSNVFKKLLRSTRFEINMALAGGRNLVITSLCEEEGKTLVSLSLVSSYQMMNKKVLLIDGNFANPGITTITRPKFFIEDYLMGKTHLYELADEGNITVLGNKGNDISLFEINTEGEIEQKLLQLKDIFDIVLIETPALSVLSQSKEWIMVADRVLCVFEANNTISAEMKKQILYLKDKEGKFIGWIFNKANNLN